MYKPSKIKSTPPGRSSRKNGDPAYASQSTAPGKPAFAETTASGPESNKSYSALGSQSTERTAEAPHKTIVNEDEQKKVVNQPTSNTATNFDDTDEV